MFVTTLLRHIVFNIFNRFNIGRITKDENITRINTIRRNSVVTKQKWLKSVYIYGSYRKIKHISSDL